MSLKITRATGRTLNTSLDINVSEDDSVRGDGLGGRHSEIDTNWFS